METELVRDIRRGDPAAFWRLFEEHGPMLYRVARSITGHEQDAEDVLQECFVTAYSRIDTLRDPAALAGWLRRIVVNTALMRLRARRGERLEFLAEPPEATPDDRQATLSADWVPRPEDALMRAESLRVIRDAVERLPDGARAVYVLAEVEGLSYAETASLLDISEGAVRVRLHRARLALREALTDYFTEWCPTHRGDPS